jgi:intracellular multiplication protein IcmL
MMAREESQVVRLKDDFYRDGFYKVIFSLLAIVVAIVFLIALSLYVHFTKPDPVNFSADNEWRVLPPVPLDQPYLSTSDLVQWISEVLPSAFTFDFVNYSKFLKNSAQYFTQNGWNKFLEQVNVYANFNTIQSSKLFVNSEASGAPFILSQGLLDGKYAWWVQMPINIQYINVEKMTLTPLVVQVLITRVPTLNNLYGVGIENIVVNKGGGDQLDVNG